MAPIRDWTGAITFSPSPHKNNPRKWFSGEMLGAQKQKPKKQPFSDASASHLSLVLWHD